MTTVFIKKKNGRLIEKTITASTRPKATPETIANISREIKERKKLVPNKMKRMAVIKATPETIANIIREIKEREKLVPNKKKRMAVISLAKSKSLSFIDALQIINKAEEDFVVQRSQENLVAKERKKLAKKRALMFAEKTPSPNQTRKKLWVSIVSGGGGPGTGKKR